ncbi:MAG: glycosyltransferase [Longimicrobiales bacterium]|nr:glycosyltransferase [Longimicrobiales bacterium]
MRVLHLETGKHVYGGALQVLLLVEGLERRGIENLLVVPEGSDIEAQALSRGLPVHPLPMAGEADLFFPPRFRRLIRSTAPDLVHLHSRRGADTLGGLGARWAGVPVVLTRRVDNPEPSWVLAAKYRLFDRVITISEAIQRVLIRQGVDPGRIRCVHSALDPSPFEGPCRRDAFLAEFGIAPDQPIVGMAAQFIPRKGHDLLLQAIPAILRDHPRTRFLLFGRGPLRGKVSRKVREAGLDGAIQIPGFREDLPDLLPCMDLLVHPAAMEGLGIILLQAAASGLPVVASAAGGIPEAVVDQLTGLLVPPSDPGALASAVSTLLADLPRARSMGKAGRDRVRSDFSVDRMVDGNLSVYRELVSESSSG